MGKLEISRYKIDKYGHLVNLEKVAIISLQLANKY